jgi:uncharacterized membrane protein
LNPFDIKSVLFAKHAQHVVLIHFPIALFIVGVAFDLVAQWKRNSALAAATYYNLLIAALSTLPVVVTGIIAWRWQLEGARLRGNLFLHLVLGTVSSLLIWTVWWMHYRARRQPNRSLPLYRLPVELAGVLTVALTGHLGGFLTGVNG